MLCLWMEYFALGQLFDPSQFVIENQVSSVYKTIFISKSVKFINSYHSFIKNVSKNDVYSVQLSLPKRIKFLSIKPVKSNNPFLL